MRISIVYWILCSNIMRMRNILMWVETVAYFSTFISGIYAECIIAYVICFYIHIIYVYYITSWWEMSVFPSKNIIADLQQLQICYDILGRKYCSSETYRNKYTCSFYYVVYCCVFDLVFYPYPSGSLHVETCDCPSASEVILENMVK